MSEGLKKQTCESDIIDSGLLQKTIEALSKTRKAAKWSILLLLAACIVDEEAENINKEDLRRHQDNASIANFSENQIPQNEIIDKAKKEQNEDTQYSFSYQNFENFLTKIIPDYPSQKGSDIFYNNFKNYINLIFTEYPELLSKDGVLLEEHFTYYVKWLQEKNLQPNTQNMRIFLDQLTDRNNTENEGNIDNVSNDTSVGKYNSDHEKEKIVDNSNTSADEHSNNKKVENKSSIFSRAKEYFQEKFSNKEAVAPSKNQDANNLSYHDQRTDNLEDVDQIERENNGDLFSIIRLQGQFFDKFTFNRITENYHTRVKAIVHEGKEYLSISDLQSSLDSKSPSDIFDKVQSANFAEKLNSTTNFNSNSKSELIDSLVESHNLFHGNQVTKKNFDVEFNLDGSVKNIYLNNREYDPKQFITSPKQLKNIPGNQINIEIGGISIKVDLGDYFKQYHKLEQQRQGTSQNISVYDTENGQVTNFRNMMWFVEDDANIYKKIAKEITKNASGPMGKIKALITWLQQNYDYIDEMSEINKITLGALIDHGGDCEDGFISLKTLASSIGLGKYVAAVYFSDHIAPIINGYHGDTFYKVNGEIWTIAELATPKGETVRPGETKKKNPWFFMLDQNTSKSADGKHLPIKIVSTSELSQNLVSEFENVIVEAENFINNPPQVNFDVLVKYTEKQIDSVKNAYQNIAKTSKMSEEVNEKLRKISQKLEKFATEILKKEEEKNDNLKRKALQNQPEHVKAQIDEFFDLSETINPKNTSNTLKKMAVVIEKYSDQTDNYDAMIQCKNEIITALNESKLFYNYTSMEKIYQETLQYLPEEKAKAVRQFLENKWNFVEPCANIYNQIGELLENLE